MPNILPLGKIHVLEKKSGANSSNESTFSAGQNILGKLMKKNLLAFGGNINRANIDNIIYTNANVAIGDRIDGHEVTADFGNGKYGIK